MSAYDHILATGHIKLVEEQPDFLEQFKSRWDQAGGTTMPTSPTVDVYSLTQEYIPYVIENNQLKIQRHLHYKTEVQWAKHTGILVKLMQPEQVWHRSRDVAVAIDALRINEAQHRIDQVLEFKNSYDKYALTDNESYEVSFIIRDETKKAMRLNFDWILSYIREHTRSSLGGGGYKWRQALSITRTQWLEIFDMIKANAEQMDAHPDWYPANVPETGERARANNLARMQPGYEGNIDRTRIITFGNWMSLWTVFIPDKASWYTKVLAKIIDVINPEGEYFFPYVLGGGIYTKFSELHQTNLPYHAYDAKTWDAGGLRILGKWTNAYAVCFGGIPQIASGQSHTSMLGTGAMICATRHLKGIKCVLGDDVGHFGTAQMNEPWFEMDEADTRYRFNLGVAYSPDPLAPRISGLKVTKDRSKDMISINTAEFQEMTGAYGGRHSQQEKALHAGLYLGRAGKGTLLERIQKIPPGEFISPSELMEQIIEEGEVDALEWARERGITEVFA